VNMTAVNGACPHCRHRSLRVDVNGDVFCARQRCVDPYAASVLLEAFAVSTQVERLPLEGAA
jgi:hypothetical protein